MSPELLNSLHEIREIIDELAESSKKARLEREARILDAYDAGHTLREIGAEVGLSFKQVQRCVTAAEKWLFTARVPTPLPEHTPEVAAPELHPTAPVAAPEFPPNAPPGAKDVTVDADGWTHWTEKGEKWSRPPKGQAPLTGKK